MWTTSWPATRSRRSSSWPTHWIGCRWEGCAEGRETNEGRRRGCEGLDGPRGPGRHRHGGRGQAVGAAAAGREDGRERARRGLRRCVRRLRGGRRGGGGRRGAERGRAAPAPLRHRGLRGLGRRPAVRRRDRRVRRGIRGVSSFGDFAAIAAADGRAALVTLVEGGEVGAKLLVRADGETSGGLGDPELDRVAVEAAEELMWAERSELRRAGDVSLFVDVTAPAPRLVIFGAVDYAAALCRLARAAGWRPFVCDPRSQFATRQRLPEAQQV